VDNVVELHGDQEGKYDLYGSHLNTKIAENVIT